MNWRDNKDVNYECDRHNEKDKVRNKRDYKKKQASRKRNNKKN